MSQNIVKGERMGLSPLAVKQLAEEFRRLAAEAKDRSRRHLAREDETAHWIAIGKDQAFAKAAQMLEEKLS